jgi:cyclopropane fatty-acyl-phospholipid synthase-like methyltransferase
MAPRRAGAPGAAVVGVTPPEERLAQAAVRAERSGLADRVTVRRHDPREAKGILGRVASARRVEHVGLPRQDAGSGVSGRLRAGRAAR